MTARKVQIKGTAYSIAGDVHMTVDYNGSRVFDSTIPTNIVESMPDTSTPPDSRNSVLGTFDTDTEVTGNIPVIITVQNGLVFFGQFWMNYIGSKYEIRRTDPDIPVDSDNKTTWHAVLILDTESNYGEPNSDTIETDGLTNPRLNGQPIFWRYTDDEEVTGDWTYVLLSNDVFEFDFYVDPAKINLS